MTIAPGHLTFLSSTLAVALASGQSDPVSADPPDSIRLQLIQSGSSLSSLDFTGNCVPTMDDIAIMVYLEINAKGLLDVDTDGDGLLRANDTIEQIRQIVAASVADPDQNGVTDSSDVSKVVDDIVDGDGGVGSDVTQDASVDGGDVIAVSGQLGRTNVIDFDRAAGVIYAFIGNIAPAVDDGTYGWHTAQTNEDCDGFAGTNYPDSDQHYGRTSSNYPAPDVHRDAVSQSFPPNHMYEMSESWPDPECSNPPFDFDGEQCEWPDPVQSWPPNHIAAASASWDAGWPDGPGDHTTTYSHHWREKPGHFYEVSSSWPGNHAAEVSTHWPTNHLGETSSTGGYPSPDAHHEDITMWWHNQHDEGTSGKWPPSHSGVLSATWGLTHAVSWSVSWPANHLGSTSSGWPEGHYPNWPPNHNGPVTSQDTSEGPPIPPTIFPPDHTYFTTIRDILQIPIPDFPWPPGFGSDGGGDDGGDDGGDGGIQ